MADNNTMNMLKGLLGDNADEKIKAVMDTLQGNQNGGQNSASAENSASTPQSPSRQSSGSDSISQLLNGLNANGLQYINQIKNVVDDIASNSNDPRSNLLMSLKPYMRQNRQKSIDSAVRMLSLTKIGGLFK